MMMTRKMRAYQEQKSHTAAMRIWRRRIAKLAVKRKATSEALGAPHRHQAGRRVFINQRVAAQEETLLVKSCLQERKDWSRTFPVYTESF